MGYSTSTEEAAKALHAISALIRNNVNGQEAFHSENGGAMLQVTTFFDSEYGHRIDSRLTTWPVSQHILGSNSIDVRLQKKAVFLVTDLADFQLNSGNPQLPFLSDRLFLKSMVDMLSKFDLDLHEKVWLELPPVPIIVDMLAATIIKRLAFFMTILLLHNNIAISLKRSLSFFGRQ